MEKNEKFQKKLGKPGYLNKNCWLIRSLNYTPYKRCQYCELEFSNCIFLHYQIISLILITFFLILFFLVEGEISALVIISVFILVIVYGYFFNKNTDKIIQSYFAERKAKEALEKLAEILEEQVKQRTKKLREANIKLDKLSRAKSEFISMASHQLRTPLTVIKGYISLILEGTYGKINGKIKEKLERTFQSNERLIRLVSDLLNVSRIEEGRIEMKFGKVNLEDLISDLVNELSIKTKEKGIYLKFEKPKEKIPEITVDKDKISEVIFNILDNAIKYTPTGGITISLKIKDLRLQIIARDTGEGMTKEELGKLFQTFSRGEAGGVYHPGGLGLGLYIAKRFVELQNGKIWAESAGKGKGSTFYIELPVK